MPGRAAVALRGAGALAAALALALGAAACGGGSSGATGATGAGGGGSGASAGHPGLRPARGDAAPRRTPAPFPAGDVGARLERPALLRATPDGRAVARVGLRTPFGSPQVLAVVAHRRGWLGVVSAQRPNNTVGWLPASAARLVGEPVRVIVDLATRRLRVVRAGRTVLDFPVAIGAPATPTPTGRFAVTDGLLTTGASPYGCCIVALSARQPHIAQGWTGGDRIAVHGTTDPGAIGQAVTHGCLRATDADVRRLMHAVTLGARVEIRA